MIVAKKKFGQNFLKDRTVVAKIIEAMPKNNDHALIEIGPGLGDLTQELLKVKPLVAYEVDEELCVYLRKLFSKESEEERLVLVCADVMEVFAKGSLHTKPYDLVANLPYYIATAIIIGALEDPLCRSLQVMIQKEVADKFAATPRTKAFSALAIMAQSLGRVSVLCDVGPESFEPQPKVTSSILQIDKQRVCVGCEEALFEKASEYEAFKLYLRHAFQNPRKTWMKNVSSLYEKATLEALLREHHMCITIRPHELDVLSHHLLFKTLRLNDARKRDIANRTQTTNTRGA